MVDVALARIIIASVFYLRCVASLETGWKCRHESATLTPRASTTIYEGRITILDLRGTNYESQFAVLTICNSRDER